MNTDIKRQLSKLAETCIELSMEERPEVAWLKAKHRQIQTQYKKKNKTDTDALLFEHMYGHAPEKTSELLKIRYWRTGKSTPGNRTQCLLLGKALKLSPDEMIYLIQNYYDRSLETFPSFSVADAANKNRRTYMKELAASYLAGISAERLDDLHIPGEKAGRFLRHLYFTDAFSYVYMPNISRDTFVKHITSTRYDSEFTRQMKLQGEIPRKTMIRHLLILGLPDLSLEILNRRLSLFGYAPLQTEHTLVYGERLDWLLIQLFQLYERECASLPARERLVWFQEACQILDAYFTETGHPRLRFMHFKALEP